jgi:aminopeptidase
MDRGRKRRGRDSNPRYGCPHNGFRDRPIQPLSHPSRVGQNGSASPRNLVRMDEATLARLADLVVGFGANVQQDQIVSIGCEPGKEYLVRALAASAYRHGAKFVDVGWFDPHVKRARVEYARADTLDFVPSWYGERVLAIGDQRGARVALSGPTAPGLLADLDPALVGKDRLPAVKEGIQVVNDRTTNWTICPCPTQVWADLVYPELDDGDRLGRLEHELLHTLRLDEDDPIGAWRARADALVSIAERLSDRRFDALHYDGPGTDLTIGLLPSSGWRAARFRTVDGIEHMPNLPTEEVFTTPDPERTQGVVTSTKPLVLSDGTLVRDLVVRFEGGRVSSLEASEGGGTLEAIIATDDGAARLGEVALVDREGRIGQLGTIFYDTLLDENAASHIALGQGFPFVLDEADRERSNESEIHIDFMIGSNELTVAGITAEGDRVPVLVEGRWQV